MGLLRKSLLTRKASEGQDVLGRDQFFAAFQCADRSHILFAVQTSGHEGMALREFWKFRGLELAVVVQRKRILTDSFDHEAAFSVFLDILISRIVAF